MAYFNTNIIARKGYAGRPMAARKSSPQVNLAHEIRHATSGMGSILDDAWSAIKGGASSALDFYGATEQQKGQNALLTQQVNTLQAQTNKPTIVSGVDNTTLLLLGAVGVVGAVLLLRRK